MNEREVAGFAKTDLPPSGGRYARYAFAIAAVLTVTMLGWQGWHLYHSFRNVDHKQSGECPTRAVEEVYFAAAHRADLVDDLEHALIVAPHAAITAWSTEWRGHFSQSADELATTVTKAAALVTPELLGAIHRVEATSAAVGLTATTVVDIASTGDVPTAVAMLTTDEYVGSRNAYVDAVESLVTASRRFFESQLRSEHQDELVSVAVAMVIFAATIGAWAVFLRRIRIGQRRLAEESRQRRAAEAELAQAQKMEALGTMAGAIAHDFNNLVTAIWGSASAARSEVDNESPAQSSLARIEEASEQANELVRGLLTFGRKTSLRQEPVNLADLAEQTVALMEPTIPEGIAVTVECETKDGPWARGDRVQLQQVLMNLILNALDAMDGDGRLGLRVFDCPSEGTTERRVCLEVVDDGAGMTPDLQEKIFEPFFTTGAEDAKGTGLGLAIVHSVVARHGGEVRCSSAPGVGSVFTLSLPQIEAAVATSQRSSATRDTTQTIDRGPIVLAEDHRHVREIMGEALSGAGYRVIPVAGGPELLAAQSGYSDDLTAMVIDLDIPAPDGMSCIRRFRAAGVNTPVVLITGTPAPNLEVEVGDMAVVLRKPFAMSQLLDVVAATTKMGTAGHG